MTTATRPEREMWPLRLVKVRQLAKRASNGSVRRITVEAGLHWLPGNARPYFSVTGHVSTLAQDRTGDWELCGCIHDEILKAWPRLAPLVALHLSDDTGEPMGAEANGYYWLAGALGGMDERYHGGNGSSGKTPLECLAVFARHCRITADEAAAIARRVSIGGRRCWREACDAMTVRWHAEAEAGKALLLELGAVVTA